MLINCVAYEEGRKLADIDKRDIRNYLARPGCFVWVALRDATEEELTAMQEEFELHPLAVEDARHGHQRPKIEEYGDSLFVALHTVELAEKGLSVGEVDVFVGRNYVLSVRSRTERGFADVRARSEQEPELLRHGSAYVLYAIMDAVVDRPEDQAARRCSSTSIDRSSGLRTRVARRSRPIGSHRSGESAGGLVPSGRRSTLQFGRRGSSGFGLIASTTWPESVASSVPGG